MLQDLELDGHLARANDRDILQGLGELVLLKRNILHVARQEALIGGKVEVAMPTEGCENHLCTHTFQSSQPWQILTGEKRSTRSGKCGRIRKRPPSCQVCRYLDPVAYGMS